MKFQFSLPGVQLQMCNQGEIAMSEFVSEVSDQSFESEVLNASAPVMVDFWAPWCGPCRMLAPVVETVAEQYNGRVRVLKMNIDDNPMTPGKYNIRSIPTLLLFKEGEVKEQIMGNTSPGTITKMLDNHI
jgi:thioredoxin 1